MNKFFATVRSNTIVQAILCVVLGIFLLIAPATATLTVVYLIGAYFAITGIITLISYFRSGSSKYRETPVLITGVAWIVGALLIFIFPEFVGGFLSLIMGIFLLISGIVDAVRSYEMRAFPASAWIPMFVVSAIVAIGGIVIIMNPFGATVTFVMVLGILLIVKGVSDLAIDLLTSNGMKAANQR
ncbi:DUF308 domain-containing protein [Eggerthellaceae bacterium 3-80]|nr:hypothetical protein D7W09_01160 [bacterium D16-34]